MPDDTRNFLIGLLFFIGVAAVGVWLISFSIRSALKKREMDSRLSTQPIPSRPHERGFPVAPSEKFFVIEGVAKDTASDVSIQIGASSAANAKVKAEMQGIVVTDVREIEG